MMISAKEREIRIAANGESYRAGALTEDQFRAYLFAMRYRGEDIRHTMIEYAPAPRSPIFEECRLEISRAWMLSYLKGCR
jgi:hypothetical protein